MTNQDQILRRLPSVDSLLKTEQARELKLSFGSALTTEFARLAVTEIRKAGRDLAKEELFSQAVDAMKRIAAEKAQKSLRRVINAAGVILHTNLGRAPLSNHSRESANESGGYCTLEYDIQAGARGRRGAAIEELLKSLTGADDALVVNNCAAAAFLVLTTLANGGEAIISRGELVEIGGDFRVPDVLAASGCKLVEVGTTNRTRIADYKQAITEHTRLIMRVHPSNFRVVGFTDAPTTAELGECAREAGLPFFEDAGSGLLVDLDFAGLSDEPVIPKEITAGVDIVCFSGDKLLGGPQAGIIVGGREYLERIRRHPLYRALRVDKLILAALQSTLDAYQAGHWKTEIPLMRMLAATAEELHSRTSEFKEQLLAHCPSLTVELLQGVSAIGGGAGPDVHPPTTLAAINDARYSPDQLDQFLRSSNPPIITRIQHDRVVLDLRTVSADEEAEIINAFAALK